MEKNINATDYTAQQLKDWLRKLGLPTNGTKNALVSRINDVPFEERGECPAVVASESESGDMDDVSLRELQLLKREREILMRENDLLKKEKESCESEIVNHTRNSSHNFSLLKEFLPEYDGTTSFECWSNQLRSFAVIYPVDENTFRALLITKLKGRALAWLQSKQNFMTESTEGLLVQMKEFFGEKESKLMMRKKFENRKWLHGESFNEYFTNKLILASALQMDEEELIDSIIDGIPHPQLRTQAIMQNFTDKMQLHRAFSKIELKSPTKSKKENVRCFNCGSVGHFAAECKKPKHERGSCFGCGSNQHRVAACPKRKAPIHLVEDENYVRVFELYLGNLSYCLPLECLIDSGSPISFVKRSCLPRNLKIKENTFVSCFGLNKSKLKVLGTVPCYMFINNEKYSFDLYVVPDESMIIQTVLGRDFMRVCRFKIICELENDNLIKSSSMVENDIMSIEYVKNNYMKCNIERSGEQCSRNRFNSDFNNTHVKPEHANDPEIKYKKHINGVKMSSSSPRKFKTIKAKLVDPGKGVRWNIETKNVEYAMKNTIHRTIQEYPSKLLFGVKQRGTPKKDYADKSRGKTTKFMDKQAAVYKKVRKNYRYALENYEDVLSSYIPYKSLWIRRKG